MNHAHSQLGLRRILEGSAFIFACRVGGAALTLITQILIARWMGAAELGVYVIAFSWCLLLATLVNLGLPMAAVRFIGLGIAQDRRAYIRGFVRHGALMTITSSVGVAIIALLVVWQLDMSENFKPAMALMLVAVPFMAALLFFGGLANSYGRFALGFLPSNVLRPLVFFCLVTIWWLSRGSLNAETAMLMQLLAVAAVAVFSIFAVLKFLRSQLGDVDAEDHRRQWLRESVPLLATILFTGYFGEINIIVAGLFLSPDQVAQFHVAFRLALLVGFGLFAVDAATAPDIARLYAAGHRADLQVLVTRATRLRILIGVLAMIGFAVFGRWVLGFFGEEFVAGYLLLLILGCGQLVLAASGPAARLLSVSGHQDSALLASLSALVIAVALIAVLVPIYGVTGAAIAATVDMAFWSIWMRQLVKRHTGVKPRIF